MVSDFHFLHSNYEKNDAKAYSQGPKGVPKIIIVEDDKLLGISIKKFLEKKFSTQVFLFESPSECQIYLDKKLKEETAANQIPFCLVTDISFEIEGLDGLRFIDLLKERGHQFVSIVMTGFATIETAINATKKGVFHYLTKPFELQVLSELIAKALAEKLKFQENSFLISKPEEVIRNFAKVFNHTKEIQTSHKIKIEAPGADDVFCGMVGRSKAMKNVFERIRKVAPTDSTVFISGPSGTGKELVAKALHNLSPRRSHNMISVNCGAIPSELLESELFGHEKGAFTGAISNRKGRFEMAHRGTIFLDEIGDMPSVLQVKLLRVLQSRVIERVGGGENIEIDVRIITATHRNLEDFVAYGQFREDLYYRLNVIPVKIPALKDRKEDIPLIISFFLSKFTSADGRNAISFDDEALETLVHYDWPGNVRELENLIERLVILKGGHQIGIEDLPKKFLTYEETKRKSIEVRNMVSLPIEGVDLKQFLSDLEDSLIYQALELTGGNKNQASKLLSLNRTTLIEKMKKKGLSALGLE